MFKSEESARHCLGRDKIAYGLWMSIFHVFHTSGYWTPELQEDPQSVNNWQFSVPAQDNINLLILLALTWGTQEN